LDLFPPSGEGETLALLGPLETANLNHWTRLGRRFYASNNVYTYMHISLPVNMYRVPYPTRNITSDYIMESDMVWTGNAHERDKNACVLIRKFQEKKPHGRPSCRWRDAH
jgi:hypothetical protein